MQNDNLPSEVEQPLKILKLEIEKAIKCQENKSPGIDIYRANKEGEPAVTDIYIYNTLSQNLDYNGMAKSTYYFIDYTCTKERRPRKVFILSHYYSYKSVEQNPTNIESINAT